MRESKKNVLPCNFLEVISILLLVAVLVTSLAGCSEDSDKEEQEQEMSEIQSQAPLLSMAYIPWGSFRMGNLSSTSSGDYSSELPIHSVTLSPFSMAQYELAYEKWMEVKTWAESHDYIFDNTGSMGGNSTEGLPDETHPVTMVNWYDAVKWCNALSEMERLTPCYYTSSAKKTVYRSGQVDIESNWVAWDADGYRLPTEAEWEYACRANTTTQYSYGYSITSSDANYWDSEDQYDNGTTPVGYYQANDYGLYDMHGNVWEWCWDRYDREYYKQSLISDPRGSSSGSYRVYRGGGWGDRPVYLRSAFRGGYEPDVESIYLGFRPVRSS